MRAKVYSVLNRLFNRVLNPAPLLPASRAGPLANRPHKPIARARKPIARRAGQGKFNAGQSSVFNRANDNAGQSLFRIQSRLLNRVLINAGQSVFGIKPSIELPID